MSWKLMSQLMSTVGLAFAVLASTSGCKTLKSRSNSRDIELISSRLVLYRSGDLVIAARCDYSKVTRQTVEVDGKKDLVPFNRSSCTELSADYPPASYARFEAILQREGRVQDLEGKSLAEL